MWNQITVEGCLTFPVNRALLSRDKRFPLDTWNPSGVQENVLGNQFSAFDSPQDFPRRISSDNVQRNREAAPEAGWTKTSHTSEDRQNQGTIPMPTFATKPLTTSSTIAVELPQNHMVGQQRQQISELQVDKFHTPQSFSVRKNDSKTSRCWTRRLPLPLNNSIQNFPVQEEGQGAESSERGSVSSWKTNRHHDLRLLSSDWRS